MLKHDDEDEELMTKSKQWHFKSTYTNLPPKFFTIMDLNEVPAPKLVLFNENLAKTLELDVAELRRHGSALFAGNQMPENATPLAQAYAGHQFGNFTNLGDGRAILLGEHVLSSGKSVDIQLKGAGITPYSRGGDGRATLGPMLREYIISEAMYALGIPTTRGLAVAMTGEEVSRERLLDGAILTRVATSHLRVGTFQYAHYYGTDKDLEALMNYAIDTLYPECTTAANKPLALLEKVIERQAALIAKWQLVGFVHGVMNTDNMTISGETIDYGPCAFLDTYRLATVFSSIDREGRYAYQNQPGIGEWNLARFAETLLPILHDDEDEAIQLAKKALKNYRMCYEKEWLAGMRKKLGMQQIQEVDKKIIVELLTLMEEYEADYTNTFLALTFQKFDREPLFQSQEFQTWLENWKVHIHYREEKEAITQLMKQANPAIIPRNEYVEEALKAAVEHHDFTKVQALLKALEQPFAHVESQMTYQYPSRPEQPYQTYCGT